MEALETISIITNSHVFPSYNEKRTLMFVSLIWRAIIVIKSCNVFFRIFVELITPEQSIFPLWWSNVCLFQQFTPFLFPLL